MPYCINCGEELVDDAKFCSECGSKINQANNERKQVFEGEIHKCPNCGEVISSFTTNCPACGFEFRGATVSNTVKEFVEKLDEIEKTRKQQKLDPLGLKKTYRDRLSINPVDEKKISLIRNFAIPNTREDLIEFLILASSNIDLRAYNDNMQYVSRSQKAVSDAWEAKFEQAYEKAKMSFGNSTEFKRVEDIYYKKHNQIEMGKKINNYALFGLLAFMLIIIFVFAFIIMNSGFIADDKSNDEERQRLEAIVQEVYSAIEEEKYTIAKAKTASIIYSGTSNREAEKWEKVREELLELIADESGIPNKDKTSTTETSTQNSDVNTTESNEDKKDHDIDPETTAAITNTEILNEKKVVKQLKVTEYILNQYGYYRSILIIENNSKFDLTGSINVKYYTKGGNLVGAKSGDIDAFEKNTKTILIFSVDEEYDRMEYEFDVEEEDYFSCVISALESENVSAKNKEILTVTNNGSIAAEFVEGYALFFNKGKLIDYEWTYFTDDDCEIKPGKSITREMSFDGEEYDSVEFYFTGRGDKV